MKRVMPLDGTWQLQGFKPGEGVKSGAHGVDYRAEGWLKAKVPGVVHLDLMENGVIPDPFYGLNEEEVRWVEEREWWYRRELEVPADFLDADAVELVFEGLDTFATIWVNGVEVGRADNMFIPWIFDVKHLLRPGRNVIAVKFDPPARVLEELEAKHGRLGAGFYAPRVYGRKAQYSFGWDWGPRLPTSGIWRSAYLIAFSGARLMHVASLPLKVSEEEAELLLEAEVKAVRGLDAVVTFELSGRDGVHTRSVSVRLEEGLNEVRARMRIPRPELWWPRGYGPQNLYTLRVRLEAGGELLDEVAVRTGIRSVELVREPDEEGKSFYFKINGVPVFCKGANWIPADNLLPRVTREKYAKLLRMAADANMNMIRVWGGGIYEDDSFYDICDELGIMVWQDFMFSGGEYPEAEWFLKNVEREVEEVVKRLRNHPSIVLWCGNNECEWSRRGQVIFHELIPRICARLDPSRPYWPSSPYGGDLEIRAGHISLTCRGCDPNSPREGDRHNWDVWHGWRDYYDYTRDNARFVSEFGLQAPPVIETIEAFTPPEERSFFSKVMLHHNKMYLVAPPGYGNERILWYVMTHYGLPKSFEEQVYWAQVCQGQGLRVGIEHWRRRKFRTGGCLIWQLNDCWPAVSWSLIDYYLRPKASYYIVKRAFSPVLVSLAREGDRVVVYVVNDELREVEGTLTISLMHVREGELRREEVKIRVPPNTSLRVLEKSLKELSLEDPTTQYLLARLVEDGRIISENTLFLEEPRHLKLPRPNIRVEEVEELGDRRYRVTIRSDSYASSVWLKVRGLEAEFHDNCIDLHPGEAKEVIVRTAQRVSAEELRRRIEISYILPPG
ncbi:MAG: glycoside hydrolase family 2 protein [Thermoprotei archaeon]|nr:MAG: glycoside hydrolase family 2 protein [Thermoprotei archaeon]